MHEANVKKTDYYIIKYPSTLRFGQSVSTRLQFLSHGVIMLGSSHARGAFGQAGVAAPLLGRLSLDGEGMNAAAELLPQGLVYKPMTLQERKTLKLRTHHQNSEVGL